MVPNPREYFRQINMLYAALLMGQVLFALVVIWMIWSSDDLQQGYPAAPFGLLMPAMLIIFPGVIYGLTRRKMAEGTSLSGLSAKLEHYRAQAIMRMAAAEGVSLMALVFGMMENNLNYLLFFAAGLLIFLYFRPSREELVREYRLSAKDQAEL